MTGNKPVTGSDLNKVDAHVLGPEDYADIPELDDAWFEKAVPHENGRPVRPRGVGAEAVSIPLSPEVVEHFRASGPGWQGRIDAALKEWIAGRKRA